MLLHIWNWEEVLLIATTCWLTSFKSKSYHISEWRTVKANRVKFHKTNESTDVTYCCKCHMSSTTLHFCQSFLKNKQSLIVKFIEKLRLLVHYNLTLTFIHKTINSLISFYRDGFTKQNYTVLNYCFFFYNNTIILFRQSLNSFKFYRTFIKLS